MSDARSDDDPGHRRHQDRRQPDDAAGPARDPGLVDAIPGLTRIAATAGWRTLRWMAAETIHTSEEIAHAVAEGESPVPAMRDATHDAWAMVSHGLGLNATDPEPDTRRSARRRGGVRSPEPDELRARGAELLRRSADVRDPEDTHPAFAHILDDLTPDEARVLRFLCAEGPQPAVDVRTNRPFGAGSELVADGLSMVGIQAGVRRLDRTKAYLTNLHRLGLVWFSREPVEPARYQVVEVQPEVTEAMKRAGRAPRTIRRSIRLTAFGEDFCRTCLPAGPGSPAPPPDR